MLHLFLGLKSLVKVSRYHTDGSVFRLHYRVTVMALLAFTFIVTTRQYIGSPIMCVHTRDIPKDVLNTYCWIHPTYTLSSAHWKRVGIDVPHPGVDKTRDERDKKHVKYYQWVGFCLFFQVGPPSLTDPLALFQVVVSVKFSLICKFVQASNPFASYLMSHVLIETPCPGTKAFTRILNY